MSKVAKYVVLALTHPMELRAMASYGLWRDERELEKDETTGYQRENMKRCWEFLDLTSRSFSAVIKQLEGDFARVICLFYLVLRGLDTVEDDMSIDLEEKCAVLESFHERLSQPGWNYTGNGSREKDRQLLVEFDKVIAEIMMLDERYKGPITRICKCMGNGMAHYARAAAASTSSYAVDTMEDYDLYCHYVAGLVGEGLSALFSASGKERPDLGRMLTLSNSMGLMLQKTNVMRDFREDLEDGRLFWPKAIWGKYTDDPKRFYQEMDTNPEVKQKALFALSEMVLDALVHAVDCLDYLSLLKNQTIFNFCAIPQVMAIATLELCFMNPDVLKKNVKIRKSLAVYLITKATNPKDAANIFLEYGCKLRAKAVPSDPNYLKICIAVGHIEQWLENRYPSWIFNADGGLSAIPQFRDEPAANSISDARIRQLPLSGSGRALQQLRGLQAGMRESAETGMSSSDYKILGAFIFGMVMFILMITGSSLLLLFYFTQEGDDRIGLLPFISKVFRSALDGLSGKFADLQGLVSGNATALSGKAADVAYTASTSVISAASSASHSARIEL